MNDETTKNIYVNLDSLLDTRLALLYIMDNDTAVEEVSSGSYFKRIRDNYGNISAEVFNTFYATRNKSLLSLALPTNIFKVINEINVGHLTDSINVGDDVKLYINTYPYVLSPNEQDLIIGMLEGLVRYTDFEIVSMHPVDEVTPQWVMENVQTLIMYDGLDWIETHMKLLNLTTCPLMDKTLISPAILYGPLDKSIKVDSSLFQELATRIKSLISIKFTDSIYFSSILKK